MSTHNICFDGEITKIIPKLSSNNHLIYFSVLELKFINNYSVPLFNICHMGGGSVHRRILLPHQALLQFSTVGYTWLDARSGKVLQSWSERFRKTLFKQLLDKLWYEPCHEIMVLFVLVKLIAQKHMRSHPMGLDVWFLVWPFIYFHTSCVWIAKALARLHRCAGSPEPSLVA